MSTPFESPPQADLSPNLADISRHLFELFDPAFVHGFPDAWIEIAYGHPDIRDGALDGAQCWGAFELDKAAAFADAKNKDGYNVYVAPALRHGKQPRDGRAKDDSVLTSAHGWTEYDEAGDDVRIDAILKDKRLVPAIIVPTGTVPHGRGHLYFKITGNPTPQELLAVNTALMKLLGTDAVQNPSRVMRLAGTISYPSAKKQARGYVAELVTLRIVAEARAYTAAELIALASGATDKTVSTATAAIDWAIVGQHAGWLKSADDLPLDFSRKGRMIVAHKGSIKDLEFDLQEADLNPKPYKSWSEVSLALTSIFKIDGRYSTEQIAAALLCPLTCNSHVAQIKDEKIKRRAVERAISRSHTPPPQAVKHSAGEPDWRERRENGSPLPSMHNARLAVAALGIDCSYDTFHNKLLFGYKDDKTRHTVESILGEITDNGIMALRQVMSNAFGFDLTEKHTRDAVISLALEHCFDPVADMLAKAEADWDGVKRLDRMAANYLNCEETGLNAACVRKTMIAAVARVRHPGCKFDNIIVLESAEGFNKSTAWRVLAGDENFSDEKIIGKGSREVQEQLSEVWIHENADLAGMKKAEVETVKSFASRMIDIARPAFGHFLKKQKRHSIEVGTTNNREYLQSQTGNRRFWPMVLLKSIDVELLRRDRLQLWGEAARYQSAGESLVLDEALWAEAGDEQEDRRVPDPWEDVLRHMPDEVKTSELVDGFHRVFPIIYRTAGEERVASSEVLERVLGISPGNQRIEHGMRLSNAMRHVGWNRARNGYVNMAGKRVKGYFRAM